MNLTPPVLRGRHLTLEPIEERHAAGVFAAMQDEEVCRYLAWPPPQRIDETLALIREARELMARGPVRRLRPGVERDRPRPSDRRV